MRLSIVLNNLNSWTLGLSRSAFSATDELGIVMEGDSMEIGIIFFSVIFDWNLTIQ